MPEPAVPDPASDLAVCVTHHESLFAPARWDAEETTWGAWVARVRAEGHRHDLEKNHAPLISLYRLRRGGQRCDADVIAVYGVCLDFDDRPIAEVGAAVEALQAAGVACLWHSTWAHDGGAFELAQEALPVESREPQKKGALAGARRHERRRLIVPLTAPLIPSAYRDAVARTIARYAPTADRHAADKLCQAFFVPSCHPSRAHLAELAYFPGGGLVVPEASPVPLAPVPPPGVRQIDRSVWQALAVRWSRSTRPQTLDLGARLKRVLDGVPFADPGERDVVLWDLCRGIVHAYPDLATDGVVGLFELSLGAMALIEPGDHLTELDIREKIERALSSQAQTQANPPDRRAAIRQAFGSSRETPYSEEELAGIREAAGVSAEDLEHAWILQHEDEYYLLGRSGEYVQAGRASLVNSARVVLAPAPVDLYRVDPIRGRRLLEKEDLLERYSTPLTQVVLSYTTERVSVDRGTRVLTRPACPRRAIAPTFDPEIDRWLAALAGDSYPALAAWLSHFPDLSRPSTGLVLTGPKSIGKSLLAKGLSRIWCETGPSRLTDAMGSFNGALLHCPFAHADESEIPRDAQGNERTGELREFVQATHRLVNEKYHRQVPLLGATRLQVSANNEDVFALNANLTAADLDAIAERFTHVRGQNRARQHLEQIGHDGLTRWIEGDAIAAHVLYLAQNPAEWQGRFGVAPAPDLAGTLAVRGGIRAGICELIVRMLRDPAPLGEGAIVVDGALYVHLDWVLGTWTSQMPKARLPAASVLIKALDGLGTRIEVADGGLTQIDTQKIVAWAAESGYGNQTRVTEWLKSHEVQG